MKQRLPLLLWLLGLLLVGSGIAYGAYERAVASPGGAPLPGPVAGLGLVEEFAGQPAADNIYFRSGNLVVWLAADQALAEAALTEVLNFHR